MEIEEVKKDDGEIEQGGSTAERRPSIVKLRGMLKRVSQSPFLNRYKTLPSTSDSSGSPMNDSANTQNGVTDKVEWNPFHHSPQDYSSECVNTEDLNIKTSAEQSLCPIFAPPLEFQNSPHDCPARIEMLENHKTSPDIQKDLFQSSPSHASDLFQTSTVRQNPGMNENEIDNLFRNLPDPFNGAPSKTQDPFESDPFRGDLFQAFKGEGVLQDTPSLSPAEVNPFHAASMREVDLFQTSSKQEEEPIGVPLTTSSDRLQSPNMTLSSQNSTSKAFDPFQDLSNETPDIFQTFASKTREDYSSPHTANGTDIFNKTPNGTNSKTMYSIPSFNFPPERKSDVFSPWSLENAPDPFDETPVKYHPAFQPNSSNMPGDIVLTTPHGTEHGMLQPTPLSVARSLALSPSQMPTELMHTVTFKRPPKPLPRTRGPRSPMHRKPEIPAVPELMSSKTPPNLPTNPVLHMKHPVLDSKPVKSENFEVFEDVLLIGQERCVEDWPEHSPQLDPDFKPAGKLKLRRESMKIRKDSGGSGEDWDGSRNSGKKKGRKFTVPLLPRRGSKDKFAGDLKYGTLPVTSKEKLESSDAYGNILLPRRSKEGFQEKLVFSGGDDEGEEQNLKDHKMKKGRKFTVPLLPRRGSKENREQLYMHGNITLPRRSNAGFSQRHVFSGGGDEGEEQNITSSKTGDVFEDMKGASGYTPQSGSKADFMDDEYSWKTADLVSAGQEDFKSKKSTKMKLLHVGRRKSKDDLLEGNSPHKTATSTDKMADEEMDGCKGTKIKGSVSVNQKTKITHESFLRDRSHLELNQHTSGHTPKGLFLEDDAPRKGSDLFSPGAKYCDDPNDMDDYKPKRALESKGFKKQKLKSKAMSSDYENPAGATSGDYYLSEAAKEAWLAAEMDAHLVAGLDEGDGDTDSLMEWWNIVEKWDEVTSDDEELMIKEDEAKSFAALADKVHKGLRVFNKVFTERAEVLWQYIVSLHALADDISHFHRKAKIANITGNTTTAVGGVAAITGLALAPVTLGASLIMTAVGVGVATAGGITSASAAISDNVNNMHDRKKVEVLLQEYEVHLLDIGKILHFINQGLYRLRGHPFLRAGTQHYSEDWEIRRAVQMIGLVDRPAMRASEITEKAVVSVQGLFRGIDKYFVKDSRELKKGCKKEVVAQIKEVANVLNDGLVELNAIREELLEASGSL